MLRRLKLDKAEQGPQKPGSRSTFYRQVIRPGETIGDGRWAGGLLGEETDLDIWRAADILCPCVLQRARQEAGAVF